MALGNHLCSRERVSTNPTPPKRRVRPPDLIPFSPMLDKRADLQALCSLPSGGILAAQRAGSSASTISSCMHCRLGRR